MEMENNPIDRLFAQKLSHFGQEPSMEAWERLQSRQQAKKKKRGAFYYVAASVSVMLLSAIALWQFYLKNDSVELRPKSTIATTRKPLDPLLPKLTEGENQRKAVIEKAAKAMHPIAIVKKKVKVNVGKKKEAMSLTTSANKQPVMDVKPESEVIASIGNETSSNEELANGHTGEEKSEQKMNVVVLNITPLAQSPTHVSTTDLADVSEEKEVIHPKTRSRAGKIWQQVKKLKNGEKVDWKEVGIRPDNIIALVKPDRENRHSSR
jgi:hypothetical protein